MKQHTEDITVRKNHTLFSRAEISDPPFIRRLRWFRWNINVIEPAAIRAMHDSSSDQDYMLSSFIQATLG